jgi:RNA polymerase sigma factor (sigma-70 family)
VPMTPQEFEVFYTAEYPKLVKFLTVRMMASFAEAEDAVQEAMGNFFWRSKTGEVADYPAAYVRKAACNAFIKERERDRQRLPRTLHGGHLTPEGRHDDRLDAWAEEQCAENLLGGLTPARREVAKLLMDGMTTSEIAEQLGKTHANIRQLRNQIKERLKSPPRPSGDGT